MALGHFARLWLRQPNSVLFRLSSRTSLSVSLPPPSGPLWLLCLNHRSVVAISPVCFLPFFSRLWLRQSNSVFFRLSSRTSLSVSLPPPSGPLCLLCLLCLNHRRHLPCLLCHFLPSPPPLHFEYIFLLTPYSALLTPRPLLCKMSRQLSPFQISWLSLSGALSRSRWSVELETKAT